MPHAGLDYFEDPVVVKYAAKYLGVSEKEKDYHGDLRVTQLRMWNSRFGVEQLRETRSRRAAELDFHGSLNVTHNGR